MLTFVVYSHTDFLDILKVQTYYLNSQISINNTYNNKVLLINHSDKDISDISPYYDRIIFYDDTTLCIKIM